MNKQGKIKLGIAFIVLMGIFSLYFVLADIPKKQQATSLPFQKTYNVPVLDCELLENTIYPNYDLNCSGVYNNGEWKNVSLNFEKTKLLPSLLTSSEPVYKIAEKRLVEKEIIEDEKVSKVNVSEVVYITPEFKLNTKKEVKDGTKYSNLIYLGDIKNGDIYRIGNASTIINFTTSSALQSNSVNDVFIYDITSDSTDYTTWFNDSTKSWWLEINRSHNPVLWNKLGSDAEVTNSEIGVDGAWAGSSTYSAAKFDDGSYSNNDANYISFGSGSWFNPNDFTVEGWINTSYSVTDGIPSDAGYHMLFGWYDGSDYIYFRPTGGLGLYFVNKVTGSSYFSLMTNIDWTANELHHIAIVYSQSKTGLGSDQQRVYLDGVMVENKDVSAPIQGDATGTFDLLTYHGHIQNWGGTIDNLKIYDYAKTNFEDRFFEDSSDRKRYFPLQSYLVASDLGLDIINSATNKTWMRFIEGTNNTLASTNHNAISALNGKIYQGSDTGLHEFNFVNDVINKTDSSGILNYGGDISTRNSAKGYGAASGTGIVNSIVNDVFSQTISTDDYVFVGTDGGVSFINISNRTQTYDDAGDACYAVDIECEDLIYHDSSNLLRETSLPVADFTADNSTSLVNLSSIVASSTEIFIGNGSGAYILDSGTFALRSGTNRYTISNIFAGLTNNVTSLALDTDNITLYVGTNNGSDGAVSKINTNTNTLLANWTTEIISNNITSLSFWKNSTWWELLVGTYQGASVIGEITSDETPPSITIVTPINGTNSSDTGLDINYTYVELNCDSAWWTNVSTNLTLGCGTNITNVTWAEGNHNLTIWMNDTANNLGNAYVSFTIDTTAPTITFISQTPSDYMWNSTEVPEIMVNVTDAISVNDSSVVLFHGMNHSHNGFSHWNWSNRILDEKSNDFGWRAENRNESKWWENIVWQESVNDIWSFSGHDLTSEALSIVDNSTTHTYYNYTRHEIHEMFPATWYVDRVDLTKENKTNQYVNIYKTNPVKIAYNLSIHDLTENFTSYDHLNIETQGSSYDLIAYVCNSTYLTGNPTTNSNCQSGFHITGTDTRDITIKNSTYMYKINGGTDGSYGSVKLTIKMSLVLYTSEPVPGNAYKLYFANNTLADNTNFNETNVLWTSGNNGIAWTQYAGTPDFWYSPAQADYDIVVYYVYACDDLGNCANSTWQTDTLQAEPNQPPITPSITYPNEGDVIDIPFYINWTTAGDLENDAYNASVYLYNQDGSLNRTLADNNITEDITYYQATDVVDGTYRINITLCDVHDACSSTLSGWNFTVGVIPIPLIYIYPSLINKVPYIKLGETLDFRT